MFSSILSCEQDTVLWLWSMTLFLFWFQVHVSSKPPFSFSCLIFMSIENSPHKALPVKDIYNWIVEHFPYYKNAPNGWKNSVRHNLSLNKCFRKVEKAPVRIFLQDHVCFKNEVLSLSVCFGIVLKWLFVIVCDCDT